ncbi:hypothetical protein N7520_008045 [Penicillium odoratum]|uniref:uncharacterized protein n=1 Tax=Penicillium odoratum TaxID=1167516 RepID=UPI002547D9E5|nr:uncharacterized protein N7520_008045 [Penicillium odoratum]KAJ5760889.1 hypothetical protein N7520_008045 [Penicillium odoratum]
MSSQGPLTTWLLQSSPQSLTRATTHPFLAAAGKGTLPKTTLSQWLSQDRLYAQSYIRFIGQLLSKIRLDSLAVKPNVVFASTADQQAVDVLIDALVNIRTELRFFESTAKEYDLDLSAISADEGGLGLAGNGSGRITTSAQISTTGSGSCPGFTGAAGAGGGKASGSSKTGGNESCKDEHDLSVSTIESGELDSGDSVLHRLCRSQGECQMQASGEVCNPSSTVSNTGAASTSDICKSEGEPVKPSSGGHTESIPPLERGGPVVFAATRSTRAYIDMFMSAGSAGVPIIEGLAVLWATEVCYLQSWKYAAAFLKARAETDDGSNDADGGALREKFIPNWSSDEFEEFVDRIGEVLNLLASQCKGAEECEMMRGRCLEWWRQVVWLEERFWPVMD